MAGTLRAVRAGEPARRTILDPDAVDEEVLPVVILELSALLARASARLLTRRPRPPDRLLDREEAARRLGTTPDWLKRQESLPFRVELSPGQVRFSELGLEEWIAARRGGEP